MRAAKNILLPTALLIPALIAAGCRKKTVDPASFRESAPLILISVDTLRADRLPAYGYERVETPAISQLARESVVYDHCYAHVPQTLPSHTSMMTGLLPYEHGVRDNIGFFVKQEEQTLPEILTGAGFLTGGFVSTYVLRAETRFPQGFDKFDAEMKRERAEMSLGELQRPGERTVEAAEEWLKSIASETVSGKRFFLFLHLYEPHTPHQPPDDIAALYPGRPYDGEVAHTDRILGAFFDFLKQQDLYDRSVIVLTSDHGEGLGDHGEQEHGVFLYNESIHVPLMIRYPGAAGGGARVGAPAQHIDLLPTVLDLYGLTPARSYRGSSLLTLAKGASQPRAIYSESLFPLYHFGWSDIYSLTDSKYKFIKTPREELFDLTKDAAEKQNLAEPLETTAAQYRYQIDQAIAGLAVEAPAEMDQEEMEKLQALGYIGVASTEARSQAQKPDPKDKIHQIEKFREGLRLHRAGEEEKAAAVFKEIVIENPDMTDALEQLGRSLARLKRADEAIDVLGRVVELKGDNPSTLMGVARILWKLKQPKDALRHLNRAIELDPDQAKAHELKGQILYSGGDLAGSLQSFDRALALDSTLPMPWYVKGLAAMQRGRDEDAMTSLQRAVSELSKRERNLALPGLYAAIGMLYEKQRKLPEAIEAYQKELGKMPSNAGARIRLAQLLISQGRRDGALALFDDFRGNSIEAYKAAAGFLASIGERQRAEAIARAGTEIAARSK